MSEQSGNPKEAQSIDRDSFDILIIGASFSGINSAYHMQENFPNLNYAILEERSVIGGTWDQFRYPGVRSDTDMLSFCFHWNPWMESRPYADGASIAKYLQHSAELKGIDRHIKFNHKVLSADWSSESQSWRLVVQSPGARVRLEARFIILGSGYYNYKEPLRPQIPGFDNFKGTVAHPQFWPEDLDYTNKRIIVIGNGATALGLVPNLATKARHVTMLQRSPAYIMKGDNTLGNPLYRKVLPSSWAFMIDRCFFILFINLIFLFCRTFPVKARAFLQGEMAKLLPEHIPLDPHFIPSFEPWDQRISMDMNGELFEAMRNRMASVATGDIKTATARSLVLESGQELEADIVVTATGLNLQFGGEIKFSIDGEHIKLADRFAWRTTLLQDVPNLGFMIGFVNSAWTLGTEASLLLLCRIIRHMQKNGYTTVVPRMSPHDRHKIQQRRIWPVDATYVRQTGDQLPKCGDIGPWRGRSIYAVDRMRALYGSITSDIEYSRGRDSERKTI